MHYPPIIASYKTHPIQNINDNESKQFEVQYKSTSIIFHTFVTGPFDIL